MDPDEHESNAGFHFVEEVYDLHFLGESQMKKCYGESSATTTQFMSIILSYGKGEYIAIE